MHMLQVPSNMLWQGLLLCQAALLTGQLHPLLNHECWVAGRAKYLSLALDRAARLWAVCNAGQVGLLAAMHVQPFVSASAKLCHAHTGPDIVRTET